PQVRDDAHTDLDPAREEVERVVVAVPHAGRDLHLIVELWRAVGVHPTFILEARCASQPLARRVTTSSHPLAAMSYVPENPLVVQSDLTVLCEVMSPRFAEGREALQGFAELVKSPEYIHTWRITALSLWNAAASGHTADAVVASLQGLAKYPV